MTPSHPGGPGRWAEGRGGNKGSEEGCNTDVQLLFRYVGGGPHTCPVSPAGPQPAAMTRGLSMTTSPSSFSLVRRRGGREAMPQMAEEYLSRAGGYCHGTFFAIKITDQLDQLGPEMKYPSHLSRATSLASVKSLCLCSRSNAGIRCSTTASLNISARNVFHSLAMALMLAVVEGIR